MRLTIRYANFVDIDTLGNIHSKSLQTAFEGIIPDDILMNAFSVESRRNGFSRELEEQRPFNAIAFEGDMPVGLLSFGDSRYIDVGEDTIELWRIYMLPQYWGSGLGEELFSWGLNEIIARGYRKVILWVLEENGRACRFYEKFGFIHNGEKIENDFGRKISELLYIKEL